MELQLVILRNRCPSFLAWTLIVACFELMETNLAFLRLFDSLNMTHQDLLNVKQKVFVKFRVSKFRKKSSIKKFFHLKVSDDAELFNYINHIRCIFKKLRKLFDVEKVFLSFFHSVFHIFQLTIDKLINISDVHGLQAFASPLKTVNLFDLDVSQALIVFHHVKNAVGLEIAQLTLQSFTIYVLSID